MGLQLGRVLFFGVRAFKAVLRLDFVLCFWISFFRAFFATETFKESLEHARRLLLESVLAPDRRAHIRVEHRVSPAISETFACSGLAVTQLSQLKRSQPARLRAYRHGDVGLGFNTKGGFGLERFLG